MAVQFELGNPDHPRGHAMLYFTSTAAAGEVLATYVIVLPIAINPAKYIPPAFAPRIPHEVASVAATALPPIPEQMESAAMVRRLAEARGDDLLSGGVVDPDPERLMMVTHEIANEYATRYRAMLDSLPPLATPAEAHDEDVLRWLLMSENERLGELSKLTGQLRHAVDGSDERLLEETLAKVEKLSRHLPEKYRLDEFLAAARRPGDIGRQLAELYIERCYKLSNEEYETLAQIDQQIDALERSG